MAEILDARVKQKTGVAADFAGYTLLEGEIALVRTSANGPVWNFKVGPGNFDSLDWSLQNPGAAQEADTSTVFPAGVPGLYIPTEDGTYEGVSVDLSVGYVQLIWDGATLTDVVFPIDLAGYLQTSQINDANLFDTDNIVENAQLLTDTGIVVANDGRLISGFIPINPAQPFEVRNNKYAYVAFFDKDENYLPDRYELTSSPETVPVEEIPEGAAFIRMNISNSPGNWPADIVNFWVRQGAVSTLQGGYLKAKYLESGNYVPDPTGLKNAANKKYVDDLPRVGFNSFKKDNVVEGFLIVTTDGSLTPNSNAICTGYIPIAEFMPIRIKKEYSQYTYIAFFDGDKNFLSPRYGASNPSNIIVPIEDIPDGAKFIRFNISSVPAEWELAIDSVFVTAEPTSIATAITNRWYGKKIIINGSSSQTPSYNYIQLAANDLGMILEGNYAIGGTCVARNPANPTGRTPLVDRYDDMSDDADLIVVYVGGNDHNYDWVPYGDFSDRVPTTFYGAMHLLCEGLKNKYVGKTIVIVGGAKRRGLYPEPEDVNAYGLTLAQHVDIQRKVSEYWGCQFLDLYTKSPLNAYMEADRVAYMPDGTHATEEGHKLIANVVRGFFSSI